MTIHAKVASFKDKKPSEFLIRFLFGGAVTALVHFIAHRTGAVFAGLFLAFPAILPAALTLVSQHDGRANASRDAQGATVGALGLLCFAIVVWYCAGRTGFMIALLVGTVTWLLVSCLLWFLFLSNQER